MPSRMSKKGVELGGIYQLKFYVDVNLFGENIKYHKGKVLEASRELGWSRRKHR
jgi:hypothetical protein